MRLPDAAIVPNERQIDIPLLTEDAPQVTPADQLVVTGEEQFGDSMPAKLRSLLLPLFLEVAASPYLIADSIGMWRVNEERFWMPRFTFQRTQLTKRRLKVGIFAGIHGDEPEAVLGLVDLVKGLNARPEVARDYRLLIYPLCNPGGLVDGTRCSRSGVDLNRQFWQNSAEPEVQLLEAELSREKFDGIIALHTDDTSDGVYGYARHREDRHDLLFEALEAAHHALPRSRSKLIDGFTATDGIIRTWYPGVLSAPANQQPQPWEIVLETPQRAAVSLQRQAFVLAVAMILGRYRTQLS